MNDDLGLVAPYLKENGFTFPVIPAYSYLMNQLEVFGIPQNLIIDPKGNWRWVQLGFDAGDATWADEIIKRLESVKDSQ